MFLGYKSALRVVQVAQRIVRGQQRANFAAFDIADQIREGADLEAFFSDLRWGIYFNAGRVCSATTINRVIVSDRVHDALVERIVAMAAGLPIVPHIERDRFGANMGEMVSALQRDCAKGMVARAAAEGATGGHRVH